MLVLAEIFYALLEALAPRWRSPGWVAVIFLNVCVLVLCGLLGGWYWVAAPVGLWLPWYVYARSQSKS